ncbi:MULTISPECIES: CvpA family protein [Paracoccus]|jgi:membrane protein required for colicin V production|uniref:CvpA family protein n=2 Tax=Paracoccus TaxID=265 RepID=A0A5C4R6B0_9RHOB|nr:MULTISPECIES: CvpA family protein [Paracoccus]KIX19069.1 colicin V production CvpA [Paracoccus sp. 228]KJZ33030.1 colicin V production CvpA [Paracoccus sp. S4493]QXI63892.1 Colicin V production protein [Paracoccus marcusii]TNH39462.1 CvpA family protein [Paracoccus haeundaensis]WDA12201.1 CvpA family protein [Paracoccus marcusii]|tara:strand:- start:1592 stop:2185 length:594 start_codon:yes stop_codon:yes gene_type:complete
MDGFTIIDAVVAAVIILSAILAWSRGFVRESLAILGWIGAAVLAFLFAPTVRPMVAQLPVLDRFMGDSCELATIAGFAVVFALALVIFSIITPLFSSVVQRSALGGVDQGMGFLFGVARGILLVAIAFIVYDRVMTTQDVPMVENSRSAQVFERMRGQMDDQIPADAPGWIVTRYEQMVMGCTATGTPVTTEAPAAN